MDASTEKSPGIQQSYLLLPGYELDGFPRHLPADDAANLLAGWVALWHPLLISSMQGIPAWRSASEAPDNLSSSLIVIPRIVESELGADFRSQASDCESTCVDSDQNWQALQKRLLAHLGHEDAQSESEEFARLTTDFAALGYAYLQIQLMTRQLRYTSNLDQLLFSEQATAAAEALVAGETPKAEDLLQACFDTLGQERDHYYSLDVQLVEVVLLAETTLGKALTRQLDAQRPAVSFLTTAELLDHLKREQTENFEQLNKQLESTACLIGGLHQERPHPLLPRESFPRDLERGQQAYRELQLESPKVFARLSYGMTSDQVADLKRSGFEGVFLIPWSGGSYPDGAQAKISWESSDGTFLSALATQPLDASDPSSFLSLGWHIGEVLDHQHVPTLLFAHWPGKTSKFFELFSCITKRTPALGRWIHADDYFEHTDEPYHQERLSNSAFRYNWLANSHSPAALVKATRHLHLLSARCRSLQNLILLDWQLTNYRNSSLQKTPAEAKASDAAKTDASDDQQVAQADTPQKLELSGVNRELQQLIELNDSLLDDLMASEKLYQQGLNLANELTAWVLKRLLTKLVPETRESSVASDPTDAKEHSGAPDSAPNAGRLLVNPRSFPVRVRVKSEPSEQFAEQDWNFKSGRVGHDRYTCIDVPSTGFVVANFSDNPPAARRERNLADGNMVQNEFLEAQIDSTRGHLRSLHVPARRGNRLSVMVARRDRMGDGKMQYSEMVASDVRMLTSSNMCGLVRATGRFEMSGKTVGKFEIDYETWRGSRILEVAIRLRDLEPLANDNPWKSAFVVRVAWPTESAILRTFNNNRRHSWSSGQVVSPRLIEIDEADYRTHYLTGGLAFHRRTEDRFLETVLHADQSQAEYRIGFAVDLPQPLLAADDFLDRRYSLPIHTAKNLAAKHGWLIHADAKNVMIDLQAPLVDSHGQTVGLRLFLTECGSKSTNTRIRLMHDVASANRVDYLGRAIGKLTCEGDGFTIVLRAGEQCNVDVIWGASPSA